MAKVTLLEKLGQLLMLQVVEDLIHGLNLKTSISNCQLKILKLGKLSFFRFFCALTLCLNRHFRPNSLVITRREKQDDNLGVTICKYLTTDKWPKAKLFKLPIKIRVSSPFPLARKEKKISICFYM